MVRELACGRAAAAGPARLLALANRAKDPIGDDDRRKAHRAIRAPDRQLVAEMLGKNSPVEVLRFVNAEVFGEHAQRLSGGRARGRPRRRRNPTAEKWRPL